MTGRLRFLIVGTPRSGTTLVQRLADELPGVRVPPETHFFRFLDPSRLRRLRFPVEGTALRALVRAYADFDQVARDLGLDPDQVVRDLGGTCRAPLDLFESVVRVAAGPAETYGEKSPPHLPWWGALTGARLDLKLVAVVRDARAVVASNLRVPWGMNSVGLLAEKWAADQAEVRSARERLGPERCLVLTYEDVVAAPDAAREALAAFLAVPAGGEARTNGRRLFLPWEQGWKGRAVGEITRERVDAWKDALSATDAARVAVVCAEGMRSFGYPAPDPGPAPSWSPRTALQRARFRAARRRLAAGIRRVAPLLGEAR